MGADFILYSVPDAKLTDDREEELRRLVWSIDPIRLANMLDGCWDSGIDSAPAARVMTAVEELQSYCVGDREVASVRLDVWPYPLLFAGGMSWGDPPSDACETMAVIEHVPEVWNKLAEWATEDCKVLSPAQRLADNAERLLSEARAFANDYSDYINEDGYDLPDPCGLIAVLDEIEEGGAA